MTEAQLKEFLEENKVEIQEAVKKKTIERLLEDYRWNISSQISEVVNTFVAEEIVPEVKTHLASQKGPIVEALLSAFANISDDLAKGLTADAAKVVGDDWQRRKVVSALFGIP